MDNKFEVNDLGRVNGFYGLYIVLGFEEDTFLNNKMIFYDLQSVENSQVIRTYEHNIRGVR